MSTFHEIARAQRGYADRAQLLGAGMSQDEINWLVANEHWQRPDAGVYLTGSAPPNWQDRVLAACLAAGGDAKAMGRTAARLRGLDGAEKHLVIEITVGVLRGPTPHGVIVRRTRRSDASLSARFNGIPVSSINETLREYAWLCPPVLAERALEDAFETRHDERGRGATFPARAWRQGRRGSDEAAQGARRPT